MDTHVKRSPWLVIEGAVLVLLGIVALFTPLAAGMAVSLVLGVILVVSGVFGLIATFAAGAHVHRPLSLASSIVALAVGLALLFYPLAGPVALTLLLAAYLLVDGILLVGMAMDHRKRTSTRWGWLLASGIVDLVLAAVLVLLSAVGSAILLGVFIGIDLIVAGAALLLLQRAKGIDLAEHPSDAPPRGMAGFGGLH